MRDGEGKLSCLRVGDSDTVRVSLSLACLPASQLA